MRALVSSIRSFVAFGLIAGGTGCSSNDSEPASAKDPTAAEKAVIDRFSDTAGHLQKRSETAALPAPNEAVDFDHGPFITSGFGPAGEKIRYYNFDVQPRQPAPIYVLVKAGASAPVPGQLNIVDVIPGDAGYSDFWQVNMVTVPADYVVNSVTSRAEIVRAGYPVEATTMLVNCPIVPDGSTATLRLAGEDPGLVTGWYRGKTVRYFSFLEKALTGTTVPVSPIYVTFTVNPGTAGGGPPSGFEMEASSPQTHNVTATLPSDAAYSPLWMVDIYDNTAFTTVTDLSTARAAPLLMAGAADVNCPIIALE
jgi:hypothetical protein